MNQDNKIGPMISLRSISFLVLMASIAVVVFFRPAPDRSRPVEVRNLLNKQNRLVIGIYMPQILNAQEEAEKRIIIDGIETVFGTFERLYGKNDPEVRLPVYIIRDYLKLENRKPPLDASMLAKDFDSLYLKNQPIAEQSPLFSLPAGELARIKQYSISGRGDEADRYRENLLVDSIMRASRFYLFFLFIMLLFPVGFAIIYRVLKKRPERLFENDLKTVPENTVPMLYETPVIYLFLLFPVASFLVSVLPFTKSIFFHMAYIPLIFGAVLYYFAHSSGSSSLKAIIGIIKMPNPLREIGFGFIGFAAIFPVALISLIFSFGVAGNDLETVRFAHPIVFEVGSNFWPVFFLAVVIAPITEEIIFRGFVFGYFRKHFNLRRAALYTGMIFAILHPQGWLAFLYLTVVGGGLAILREYRPGILAPMVTHALINSVAVISVYLLWNI